MRHHSCLRFARAAPQARSKRLFPRQANLPLLMTLHDQSHNDADKIRTPAATPEKKRDSNHLSFVIIATGNSG
jgi:hypothetical protein